MGLDSSISRVNVTKAILSNINNTQFFLISPVTKIVLLKYFFSFSPLMRYDTTYQSLIHKKGSWKESGEWRFTFTLSCSHITRGTNARRLYKMRRLQAGLYGRWWHIFRQCLAKLSNMVVILLLCCEHFEITICWLFQIS